MTDGMNEKVQVDSYVTLHYRVSILDPQGQQQVFISTFGNNPATLQMGTGQWISAMEKPLIGHAVGDSLSFRLPENSYGQHNPDLVQVVSLDVLLAQAQEDEPHYEEGDMVQFMADDGAEYSGVIVQIQNDQVTMDFNHPLAGKAIQVDVQIVGVL